MLSKNRIKFVKSLQQKKFRNEHNLFVAEGAKLVEDLLLSSIIKPSCIYASKAWLQNRELPGGVEGIVVSDIEMAQLSGLETPNKVLAVCPMPHYDINEALADKGLVLVLDDIRDPGNLGTIIRIADWFGITHVVCSENTVDVYNSKVVQSTMGSLGRIRIHYAELIPFLKAKKQAKTSIYAALLNGNNIYNEKLDVQAVLIMGNEARGISETLFPYISQSLTIPAVDHAKPYATRAESLNVAVATAILCAAFRKI